MEKAASFISTLHFLFFLTTKGTKNIKTKHKKCKLLLKHYEGCPFSFDAHHNRSLRMQLKVVWYHSLLNDTERPALITDTACSFRLREGGTSWQTDNLLDIHRIGDWSKQMDRPQFKLCFSQRFSLRSGRRQNP